MLLLRDGQLLRTKVMVTFGNTRGRGTAVRLLWHRLLEGPLDGQRLSMGD